MVLVETPICDFGQPAPDFRLEGTDGRFWSRDECMGEKGLLVMFICNHCPYVKAIVDKLVRDTRELMALGVGCVGIMPNDVEAYPADSFENMQEFAKAHDFGFPYLIDRDQQVAREYGAVCTPDFFGFNRDAELQYRGRLDAAGRDADAGPLERELFEAMKQVAETGRGPRQQIASMGCSIKWRDEGG